MRSLLARALMALVLIGFGSWAGSASAGVIYRWTADLTQPDWNNPPWLEPDRSGLYLEFERSYYLSGHSAGSNFQCTGGPDSCEVNVTHTPVLANGLLRVSWSQYQMIAKPCGESAQPNCDVLPDPDALVMSRTGDYWYPFVMSWDFELENELVGYMGMITDISHENHSRYRDGTLTLSNFSGTAFWRENGRFILDQSTVCQPFPGGGATGGCFPGLPEPGTLALLGLGLAGIAFTHRRKH